MVDLSEFEQAQRGIESMRRPRCLFAWHVASYLDDQQQAQLNEALAGARVPNRLIVDAVKEFTGRLFSHSTVARHRRRSGRDVECVSCYDQWMSA